MDKWSITFIICTAAYRTLTTPSMTHFLAHSYIVIQNYDCNSVSDFSLNCNRQDGIKSVGCQSTSFEVQNFYMAFTTLAHTQTKYHVPQFHHW